MFPETPQTLLKKIADLANGDDAAVWLEFVELYTPPLKAFIRAIRGGQTPDEVDDAVQEVFIRLVDVLRNEKIDRRKGKFRDYLAALTRRLLIDRYRAALVRPSTGSVPIPEGLVAQGTVPLATGSVPVAGGVTELDPGVQLDLRWRLAAHAAAVEHVLTKTAISEQSKRVYAALERGQSLREAAEAFGISYAAAKQIKSRLDRAVEAVVAHMR